MNIGLERKEETRQLSSQNVIVPILLAPHDRPDKNKQGSGNPHPGPDVSSDQTGNQTHQHPEQENIPTSVRVVGIISRPTHTLETPRPVLIPPRPRSNTGLLSFLAVILNKLLKLPLIGTLATLNIEIPH